MDKPIMLTAVEYNTIKDELDQLKNTSRRKVVEKLETARSLGADTSDNEEYLQAKEELDQLDARIERIEGVLNNAVIIESKE